MRTLLLLAIFTLTALAPAQDQSGRSFRRDSRTATTPAASAVAEASTRSETKRSPAPLQRLRSGRAWPQYHFTRLPETPATTTAKGAQTAEASAPKTTAPARRRGFWRAR